MEHGRRHYEMTEGWGRVGKSKILKKAKKVADHRPWLWKRAPGMFGFPVLFHNGRYEFESAYGTEATRMQVTVKPCICVSCYSVTIGRFPDRCAAGPTWGLVRHLVEVRVVRVVCSYKPNRMP